MRSSDWCLIVVLTTCASGCDDPFRGAAGEPCLPLNWRSAEGICLIPDAQVSLDGAAADWGGLEAAGSGPSIVFANTRVADSEPALAFRVVTPPLEATRRLELELSAPAGSGISERHVLRFENGGLAYLQNDRLVETLDLPAAPRALLADGFEGALSYRLLPWADRAAVRLHGQALLNGVWTDESEGASWLICWAGNRFTDACGARR